MSRSASVNIGISILHRQQNRVTGMPKFSCRFACPEYLAGFSEEGYFGLRTDLAKYSSQQPSEAKL